MAIGWSALLPGEHVNWPVPATAAIVLCCMTVCLRNPPQPGRTAAAPAADIRLIETPPIGRRPALKVARKGRSVLSRSPRSCQ